MLFLFFCFKIFFHIWCPLRHRFFKISGIFVFVNIIPDMTNFFFFIHLIYLIKCILSCSDNPETDIYAIKTHFPHLSLTLSLHRVLFTRRIILHALNSLVNQCWSCSRSQGRQICYSQDVAEISRLHCLNYFSSAQRFTSVHIYKLEQCSQYSHDAVRWYSSPLFPDAFPLINIDNCLKSS